MKYFAAMLALVSAYAFGADIVFYQGRSEKIVGHVGVVPDSWRPRIVLIGDIVPGDDRRLSAALKQAETQSKDWNTDRTLRLNSGGGDVATAISIGRLARKAQLTTIVQENSICASACVLVLAGGTWRIAWGGSRLGLHRPYFSDAGKVTGNGYEGFQRAYDSVLETHRAYFTEMRIGTGLLERMVQIPSNNVEWIDHATASRLNLLGEDATYAEWKRAQRIAKKGRACVEWEDKQGTCLGRLGFPADGVYERCIEVIGRAPSGCS